jgi:beta-glucosidase
VLVLVNDRPLSIPWAASHVSAILEAWMPGEQGGQVITDVLFGVVNPGGKLPMSVPWSVGQVPVYYNHTSSGGATKWFKDYVDGPSRPLFPFGHGLSYTRFSYGSLKLDPSTVDSCGTARISLQVTNEGTVAGDEVVQLYLHDKEAAVSRPLKELAGFARVSLAPGETVQVEFVVDLAQLCFLDEQRRLVVEPGMVEVMVGGSSEDIRLRDTLRITGEIVLLTERRVFTSAVNIRHGGKVGA